jgi:hypothetical protein
MTMQRLAVFEEARRRTGALNRLPPRVVPIEVERVVGSADRAKASALRADFLPRRHGARAPRYRMVLAAMRAGTPLPAIEVYGLAGAYYVVDGHHRVAAARALGQLYLDALVHEFPLPGARDAARTVELTAERGASARPPRRATSNPGPGARPPWRPTLWSRLGQTARRA